MKYHRWWLSILPVFLLGILLAVAPQRQNSLQLLGIENHQSDRNRQPISAPETAQSPLPKLSPTEQVRQQVTPAVVTVYGANGLGAGIIVRSQGVVITNKHIVDQVATVRLKTTAGEEIQGTVVDFDLQYDLALVKLDPPRPLPTVQLADTVMLKPGDRVYAIGTPGGKAGTLTTGTFTRITVHGSLQTSTGLLNPGNSGGPLLNAQGQVIGVNKGLLDDNSGLATPVSAVKTLLQRYETINQTHTKPPTRSSQGQ